MLSNIGLGEKAKKCLCELVIVPTALQGAKAWGMRSAERIKVNVIEMKCLRSWVGVSGMDRVMNEEVHRRSGIERELAIRVDQKVLRWFEHVEGMGKYSMAERVLMAEVSGGWVYGDRKQWIGKSGEPWFKYRLLRFTRQVLICFCVLTYSLLHSGCLSLEKL